MKSLRRVRFEPKENGIHVANLPSTVTTDFIKSLFSESGQVINVVLKQKPTSCFAFVDFALKEEAEAAVRDFNYTKLNGESIIVTRTTSEIVSAIQSGQGNLFIRGLDPTIDCLQLHELFSNYGDIISCRIPTLNGQPRGFAYVQFLTQADAERAQKELSDSTVNGKPIQIGPFLKRAERPTNAALQSNMDTRFTNVFIKNLPETIVTLLSLLKLFAEFGNVVSARIVKEKRLGYVMMADHDSAVRAVVGLCGRTIFGSRISACRSLGAAERENFVKKVIYDGTQKQNKVVGNQAIPQETDESSGFAQPVFHQQEEIDQDAAAVFQAQSAFGKALEYEKRILDSKPNDSPKKDKDSEEPIKQTTVSKTASPSKAKELTLPEAPVMKSFEIPPPQPKTEAQNGKPIIEKSSDGKTGSSTPNGSEPESEPASESLSENDAETHHDQIKGALGVQEKILKREPISSSEDDRPKPTPQNPFG